MSSPRSRVLAGCAAAVMMLSLAACSQDGDPGASADPSKPAGSEATTTSTTEPPPSTQVIEDMGDDFRGILADVDMQDCSLEKGTGAAGGTVTNSDKDAADISIAVIWLKKDSGDSVAIGEWTAKDVAPGETVEWSIEKKLKSNAARCVLNARANVAGTIK